MEKYHIKLSNQLLLVLLNQVKINNSLNYINNKH